MIIKSVSFLIMIIIIMFLCIFISIIFGHYTIKEHFSDNNEENDIAQRPIVRKKYRQKYAIESCDLLRPKDVNDISGVSHDHMRTVLDGHRLNKFKPKENDPLDERTQSNLEYCYMYDDAENNMKDYMLHGHGCSLENPIFKNVSFISNVFSTKYQDKTHTLPIQKCVVEIDPRHLNNQNLDSYWSKWGSEMCNGLSGPIQTQISDSRQNIESLSNDIIDIKSDIDDAKDRFDVLENSNLQCTSSNTELNNLLEDYTRRYNNEFDLLSSNQDLKDERFNHYQNQLKERENIQNALEDYIQQLNEIKANNDACQNNREACNIQRNALRKDRDAVVTLNNELVSEEKEKQDTFDAIYKDYLDLVDKESRCQTTVQQLTDDVDQTREEYLNKKSAFEACEPERIEYMEKAEQIANDLDEMLEKEKVCQEERITLEEKVENCEFQKNRCHYLENEYKQTLERLENIKEKVRQCNEERNERLVIKDELLQTNLDYYNELDKLIYNNYQSEKEVYQNQMKHMIDYSDQILLEYAKSMEDMTARRISASKCEQKRDRITDIERLKSKNNDLRFRLEVLDNQVCNYCKPTVKQCADKFPNESALCSI